MKRKHYARIALAVISTAPLFFLPPLWLVIYALVWGMIAGASVLAWLLIEAFG